MYGGHSGSISQLLVLGDQLLSLGKDGQLLVWKIGECDSPQVRLWVCAALVVESRSHHFLCVAGGGGRGRGCWLTVHLQPTAFDACCSVCGMLTGHVLAAAVAAAAGNVHHADCCAGVHQVWCFLCPHLRVPP